ncbi:hypothetical protein OKW30_006006 [Paraburkholderia sp. Clong3]|uniref:hypothetical protein n=1 Tax=unclassified Paraburkholderia TaxID=2615204 RepID=UPI003D1E498F
MKPIQKVILYGMLPFVLAAGAAHAQGIGRSGTYTMPPDWAMMMDKLTPEQRSQAIDIQEKMMKMDMEHQQAMAQMEMKHAQAMMQLQTQLLDIFKGH